MGFPTVPRPGRRGGWNRDVGAGGPEKNRENSDCIVRTNKLYILLDFDMVNQCLYIVTILIQTSMQLSFPSFPKACTGSSFKWSMADIYDESEQWWWQRACRLTSQLNVKFERYMCYVTPGLLQTISSMAPAWMHQKRPHRPRGADTRLDCSVTLAPDLHGSTRGWRNNDLQLSFSTPPAPPRHIGRPPLTSRQRQSSSQTDNSRAIWRGATPRVWDYCYTE